jgi:HPt (histidine-containing phosphotransfer) domain-containing protein
MEWLDKLRQAYELLDKYGASAALGLREFADVLHRIEDGARQAADFLDGPTPVGSVESGDETTTQLEALRNEVGAKAAMAQARPHTPGGGPPVVGAGGFWLQLGFQVLLQVIEEIAKRRREKSETQAHEAPRPVAQASPPATRRPSK